MNTITYRNNPTTINTTGQNTTVTTTTTRAVSTSERKQKRDALLASIRLAYWALSPEARNGFQRLCRQIPGNQVIGKTGMKQKITTFLFFSLLNQAARYSGASEAVTEPADRPEYPDPVPSPLKLVSAYNAQGVWSLKLSGAAYTLSISAAFAPPAMETSPYRQSDFVQGQPLPGGVPLAGVDLTAQFLAIYPAAPLAGEKVAVQIMGVLPSGFATEKVTLPAFTTAPAAEGSDQDEERLAA